MSKNGNQDTPKPDAKNMDTQNNFDAGQGAKPKKKPMPKYNMWQNVAWMICTAWREKEKKALVITILLALLAVARNLTDLYITPTILAAVESKAPLEVLLGTILGFIGLSMLLTGCDTYANCNYQSGKITVRFAILNYINQKLATVSSG